MPKIAEIEGTPNPNAMKFILKEPLTWGITRSYDNPEQAKDDPLASQLFDIEHVTNVFYVDHWITVTQDGASCVVTVNPGTLSFNSRKVTGTLTVSNASNCAWTATS